jgi:hypothetical protein
VSGASETLGEGFLWNLKADILEEASRDLYYLAHIRRSFAETREAASATDWAVDLIENLVSNGFCTLATWGPSGKKDDTIELDSAQLHALVDRYQSFELHPFDYFLLATEKGRQWVDRYHALLAEL